MLSAPGSLATARSGADLLSALSDNRRASCQLRIAKGSLAPRIPAQAHGCPLPREAWTATSNPQGPTQLQIQPGPKSQLRFNPFGSALDHIDNRPWLPRGSNPLWKFPNTQQSASQGLKCSRPWLQIKKEEPQELRPLPLASFGTLLQTEAPNVFIHTCSEFSIKTGWMLISAPPQLPPPRQWLAPPMNELFLDLGHFTASLFLVLDMTPSPQPSHLRHFPLSPHKPCRL